MERFKITNCDLKEKEEEIIRQTQTMKPFVLSIAGLDPSGGAGLLADIKTFEAHSVNGLGVCTALTFQNDSEFEGVEWVKTANIIRQSELLFKKYKIGHVKIGLIENLSSLKEIVEYLKGKNAKIKIIWDPVLRASAGYIFHKTLLKKDINDICSKIDLITPNIIELTSIMKEKDTQKAGMALSRCCPVLLKGGHSKEVMATDKLFLHGNSIEFSGERSVNDKHGTGCILSAAILSGLSKGLTMEHACHSGKTYITKYLNSSKELLGAHNLVGKL